MNRCLDCPAEAVTRSLCSSCYGKRRRKGLALPPKKPLARRACKKCGVTWEAFSGGRKFKGFCKGCSETRWRKKESYRSGGRLWVNALMARHGLTPEQYNEMLTTQGGVCAICGCAAKDHRLHVDHNHETGVIRGLLCNNCNRGIGHLKESIPSLRAAIRYLKRYT